MIRPAQTEKREAPQTRVLEIDAEIDRLTLGELVSRCRRGDRAAAKTLRQVLHEYPDLFQGLGQAALKVQTKWIRAITGSDLFEREMALRATRELREALLAEGSGTQLEKLVVEQVISSQLQQAYHESSEAETASRGAEVSKYRQDAIERASRRHMKALGTLANLRTLMPRAAQNGAHRSAMPLDPTSRDNRGKPQLSGVNRLSGALQDHGQTLAVH